MNVMMTSTPAILRYVPVVACDCSLIRCASSLNEIYHGKDDDPHDVDEMPVQAGDLDGHGVCRAELAAQRLNPQRQQPDDADRHVRAVGSGENEKGGPEEIRRQAQPLVHEVAEFPELPAQKNQSEERGHQ